MFIPGLDLQIAPAISDDTPELLAMGLRTEDGRLGRAQGASQARKPLPRRSWSPCRASEARRRCSWTP